MKHSILVLAIVAATIGIGTRAQAQNYPWCAYYGGGEGDGGGSNCGFTTRDQCMATVSGIGGICMPNTQYQPPPGSRPSSAARRRNPYNPS